MWTLVVLSAVALMCACALVWVRGSRARRLLAGMPTFPQLPLIGNMHQFYGDSRFLFKKMDEITQIIEKTQLPFVFWIGPSPCMLICDPEDVKLATNTFVEKPYLYSFARIWLGDGLVTASGAIWKRNIKKLAGTFTSGVVDGYLDVFNAQAQRLVERLKTRVGDEPFDCMHYFALTTLEAICQAALGVPHISDSVVTEEYYQAFNRSVELMVQRGLNLVYHPDFVYRRTPAYREMVRNVAVIHNVSAKVMEKRTKERKENVRNNASSVTDSEPSGKTRFTSFLDILLELQEKDPSLTEEQIKAEVDTIILGGQETVATTLLYCLLMIGSHTDVQEALVAEMKEICGDSNRPVTKEDLSRMEYCEAVIYETLRMFPPFPGIMRLADKDLKIKSCTIPAGTIVCVCAWGAGRSSSAWGRDAGSYRPARWLHAAPADAAAFLAFSYGRRACIGKKYAIAFLKTILAHCVRELRFWSEADKLELGFDIVLRPLAGHRLQVTSCTIPAGTIVCVCAWGAGRSSSAWGRDAGSYRPARWLHAAPADAAAFLAFSYGRRACIGKKYAIAFLKTILAHCVRELRFWSEADKLELGFDIVLRPLAGHRLQVTVRE